MTVDTTRIPTVFISREDPLSLDYSPATRHHPKNPSPYSTVLGLAETIKIDHIRSLYKILASSPKGDKYKTIFLLNCHTMSIPAQNALLKSLEEHPSYIRFILHTNNLNSLLDTIISRCRVVQLPSPHQTKTAELNQLDNLINNISQREEAIELTQEIIATLRHRLKKDPNLTHLNHLKLAIRAFQYLKANAHIGLTLHYLASHLSRQSTHPPHAHFANSA